MKYNILGFDQGKLIEYGLDIKDALLLRYFIDFRDTNKMRSVIIDGTPYYWIKYLAIKEEYPILDINNADPIYRRFKKMANLGILNHKTIKQQGTFSYYTIGNNYSDLISNTVLKTTGYGFKNKGGTVLETTGYVFKNGANNPSTIYPSTKDNSTIYKDIISYLNDKTNSHYKYSTKKTKSLIDARLKEKFTVEDFKAVIDKKVKEWLKDTKMVQYLRPQTLFGTNFESYLNQKEVQNDTRCNGEDKFANFKPKAPKTTDL